MRSLLCTIFTFAAAEVFVRLVLDVDSSVICVIAGLLACIGKDVVVDAWQARKQKA